MFTSCLESLVVLKHSHGTIHIFKFISTHVGLIYIKTIKQLLYMQLLHNVFAQWWWYCMTATSITVL